MAKENLNNENARPEERPNDKTSNEKINKDFGDGGGKNLDGLDKFEPKKPDQK
jgi:hypothetical protein